jgi:hypothetical protein
VIALGSGTVKLQMEIPFPFRLGHQEAKRIKKLREGKDILIYF